MRIIAWLLLAIGTASIIYGAWPLPLPYYTMVMLGWMVTNISRVLLELSDGR